MGKESGGMRALMRDYGCSVGAWFFSSFVIFVSTAKEFFLKKIFQRVEGAKLQQKRSTLRKFQKIFAKFAASEASAQARLTDK